MTNSVFLVEMFSSVDLVPSHGFFPCNAVFNSFLEILFFFSHEGIGFILFYLFIFLLFEVLDEQRDSSLCFMRLDSK